MKKLLTFLLLLASIGVRAQSILPPGLTLNDSTNDVTGYAIRNNYAGTSSISRFITYANNPFNNDGHYLSLGAFSYSYSGFQSFLAGWTVISSGGNSKGIINFFDGRYGWVVSSQKPLISGGDFSYDIYVPAASYSYSSPSPGVGFGWNKPNIARVDSFSRSLTVVGKSQALIELVNTGVVSDGTIVGSVYGYSDTLKSNTIGRIDFINNGSHKNSGSIRMGTYRSGVYKQGLLIDSNQNALFSGSITIGSGTYATGVSQALFTDGTGLLLASKGGSVYDLQYINSAGSAVVQNPTGTTNLNFGGSITASTGTFFGPVRLAGYTVATLPAGTQGDTAYVTDALAPSFLTIVVGGGSTVAPVFFNGTNWVGH